MYGKGLIKGMAITIKHYFGPKMTQQYPEEKPVLQKRFRVTYALNLSNAKPAASVFVAVPTAP